MFQPKLIEKQAAGLLGPRAIGSFVAKTRGKATQSANPNNVELFNQSKVDELASEKIREDGNGFFADMAIGGLGKVTPRSWDLKNKILDPLDRFKTKVDEVSTNAAGKIVGDRKDSSMVARFFSTPDHRVLGKETLSDGSVREIGALQRKTSLVAPLQNTAKFATPLLASTYVAEKMYAPEQAYAPEEVNEKQAFELELLEEKNGLEDELLTERLDKKAALDKVAELQDEVEKLASDISALEEEKRFFHKKAEAEFFEKTAALKEKQRLEKELLEKQAAHEEYRLRMIAKARSKNAVKVAEDMLERGLIKQAEYDGKVDFLMDCDDKTFNLHSSLTKAANSDEKGLETSPYIIDYRSKDEESSPHRAGRQLSRKGQTIGEAAKDLIK